MELIYYYTSHRSIPSTTTLGDLDLQKPTNKFVNGYLTDGICNLLDLLAETCCVDHVYCVITSKDGCGVFRPTTTTTVYCLPNIECSQELLQDDTLLFFRGGFKDWLPFLKDTTKTHWSLYYRANTSHSNWPFWDVILDDLMQDTKPIIGLDKIRYPYRKPVNQYIFRPVIPAKHTYDIVLGASHIHTKKGQWLALQACNMLASRDSHFMKLRYILPGSPIKSSTNSIINTSWPIQLIRPGFVKRSCLARILNSSKLFIHAGSGGQNDRSVLEALACGVPVVVRNPKAYSPWMKENNFITICNTSDREAWACAIQRAWAKIPTNFNEHNAYRFRLVAWYYEVNGLWDTALPLLKTLITALKETPCKDVKGLGNKLCTT